MAGINSLLFHLLCLVCSLYYVDCSHSEVHKVIRETKETDNQVYKINNTSNAPESDSTLEVPADVTENNTLAGGPVSIDCLRCLCLKLSNCRPIGCVLDQGMLGCGYFRFTNTFWKYCGQPGKDWRSCSNDLSCASQCVQNFMRQKAESNDCSVNCEGYSREIVGGPNGCNNPRTIAFWEKVQEIPGCKGVQ